MARARIELRGALTHTRGQRSVTKGAPQVITDANEIAYYKAQTSFSVTILEEPQRQVLAAAPKRASKEVLRNEEPPL
jgi:uncharacterized membrane protein YfbV (UPF0208 family)